MTSILYILCLHCYFFLYIVSCLNIPLSYALLSSNSEEVWILILVCTSVAGVVLWLLQKVWSWVSSDRSLSLDFGILYSWGLLLQDPPTDPPVNISGQVEILSGFNHDSSKIRTRVGKEGV